MCYCSCCCRCCVLLLLVVLLLLLLLLLTQSLTEYVGLIYIIMPFLLMCHRAPLAPTVVPGEASSVHDVLLLLLPALFCSCSGAAAMYVCAATMPFSAAAAAMSAICFVLLTSVSMVIMQVHPPR